MCYKRNYIHLWIRSVLFFIFFILSVLGYGIILSVARVLFPLRIRYHMVAAFVRAMVWLLKITCRVNYAIEGLENIPTDRNGIMMSKHQSMWETLFLPGLFHDATIILKRELLWVPFFGWGLASVNPIAINRNQKTSAMEQILEKGKTCLDEGRWILIFPEGTRIAPGKIGKYKMGGARLAVHAGCPIIPIAHNAGRYWPKRQFIKKPGTIRVIVGPAIESVHRKPEEVLADVKNWIEGTIEKNKL